MSNFLIRGGVGKWVNLFLHTIGFFVLAYFLSRADFIKIFATLSNIDFFWFALAVLTKLLIWLGRSFKWKTINLILGLNTEMRRLLVATAGTDFWAQISPARVGEIIKIGYFPSMKNKILIIAALFIDRFFDFLVLVILGVTSTFIIASQTSLRLDVVPLVFLVVIFSFLLWFLFFQQNKKMIDVTLYLSNLKKTPSKISKLLEKFAEILLHISVMKPRNYFIVFFYSLVLVGIVYARAYFIMKALAIEIPLSFLCLLITVNFFVQVLPITVMGIGTRDLVFVYGFGYLSLGIDLALSFSFLFLIIRTIDLLISYLCWVFWPPDLAKLK